MTSVVLATRNPHKVVELRRILVAAGLGRLEVRSAEDVPGAPDVAETATTFAGNALLKAHAVASAAGLPAIADDSGLGVAVMGGSPGIFSARWSGRHGDDRANLELLLAQLTDVPDEHRAAWFTCAAAVALPDGTERVVEGRLDGAVVRAPRGSDGFGYDPVFVPEGGTATLAEIGPGAKDAISHRGRALRALVPHLSEVLGVTHP